MYIELEIAVSHWPLSDNFSHLAEQIKFARPNLLHISNGKTIDSPLQCSCFQGMADQNISSFVVLIVQLTSNTYPYQLTSTFCPFPGLCEVIN